MLALTPIADARCLMRACSPCLLVPKHPPAVLHLNHTQPGASPATMGSGSCVGSSAPPASKTAEATASTQPVEPAATGQVGALEHVDVGGEGSTAHNMYACPPVARPPLRSHPRLRLRASA